MEVSHVLGRSSNTLMVHNPASLSSLWVSIFIFNKQNCPAATWSSSRSYASHVYLSTRNILTLGSIKLSLTSIQSCRNRFTCCCICRALARVIGPTCTWYLLLLMTCSLVTGSWSLSQQLGMSSSYYHTEH